MLTQQKASVMRAAGLSPAGPMRPYSLVTGPPLMPHISPALDTLAIDALQRIVLSSVARAQDILGFTLEQACARAARCRWSERVVETKRNCNCDTRRLSWVRGLGVSARGGNGGESSSAG